jgi:hypothetical protein
MRHVVNFTVIHSNLALQYVSDTSISTQSFHVNLRTLLSGYTTATFVETLQTAFKTAVAAIAR